jgi:integrase/recombinase XerD
MQPKAPRGTYWRDGVLWGRVTINGRKRRWSLRTSDPKVAKERRKQGKERLVAQAHYGDERRTFAEVLVEWAEQLPKQVGTKTADRYACSMQQLKRFVRDKYLDSIDGKLVATIIRERSKTDNASNATIKRDLVALSSVMNFAIDQGWREDNPVLARMRRLKERRIPIELPEVESIEKVIRRAPGMFASLIEAAWKTGARQEELAGAERRQYDCERKQLTVIGKGKKRRVVDLEPFDGLRIFECLPAAVGKAALFWHGKGERYANVSSRFAALVREIAEGDPDFRPFRFHDLRHRHAVEWLRSGRSIYDLQERLGHTSVKTTEIYLQFLSPNEKRIAKYGPGTQKGTHEEIVEDSKDLEVIES